MKLFISWSKGRSRQYALAFREWIDSLFPQIQPFMSDVDIDAGEAWLSSILGELGESDFGVVFITEENLRSEWIHFECGSILKGVGKGRLVPVLCDVDFVSLQDSPLRFYQGKKLDRQGVLELCQGINAGVSQGNWKAEALGRTFDALWPNLEAKFATVSAPTLSAPSTLKDPVRDAVDKLAQQVQYLTAENKKALDLLSIITLHIAMSDQGASSESKNSIRKIANLLNESSSELRNQNALATFTTNALADVSKGPSLGDLLSSQMGRRGGHSDLTE